VAAEAMPLEGVSSWLKLMACVCPLKKILSRTNTNEYSFLKTIAQEENTGAYRRENVLVAVSDNDAKILQARQ
jgi:hypothetical protein